MQICAIYLSIYLSNYFFRTCIERFGRTPRVECSSSADCSLVSTECPEHDCLPGRQGKTLCTWITY